MKSIDTPIEEVQPIVTLAQGLGKRVVYHPHKLQPTACKHCGHVAISTVCNICKEPKIGR